MARFFAPESQHSRLILEHLADGIGAQPSEFRDLARGVVAFELDAGRPGFLGELLVHRAGSHVGRFTCRPVLRSMAIGSLPSPRCSPLSDRLAVGVVRVFQLFIWFLVPAVAGLNQPFDIVAFNQRLLRYSTILSPRPPAGPTFYHVVSYKRLLARNNFRFAPSGSPILALGAKRIAALSSKS